MITFLIYVLGFPIVCMYIKVCEGIDTKTMPVGYVVFVVLWPISFFSMALYELYVTLREAYKW